MNEERTRKIINCNETSTIHYIKLDKNSERKKEGEMRKKTEKRVNNRDTELAE